MSIQQHSQSFDYSLSGFDSAGLSLCNIFEMENFTGNSNLETQTGSIEIVNVTNEGVQSASLPPMILLLILVTLFLFACHRFFMVQEKRNLFMMQA